MREARLSPDLPEHFARLYNYETGKFDTPLDSHGIADIDATFELALRTFPDEIPDFEGTNWDIHHVYWSESFWRQLANDHPSPDKETIHEFRNSTPQLAYVPRIIHPWIEEIMVPPPAPPIEVMRRRNDAWSAAKILLQESVRLDKARTDYETKKDTTRIVLGNIPGVTPRSKRRDKDREEVLNREYWLSELNDRLEGWRNLSEVQEHVPAEDRIVAEARLVSVRALARRIRHNAMVPKLPASLGIAS